MVGRVQFEGRPAVKDRSIASKATFSCQNDIYLFRKKRTTKSERRFLENYTSVPTKEGEKRGIEWNKEGGQVSIFGWVGLYKGRWRRGPHLSKERLLDMTIQSPRLSAFNLSHTHTPTNTHFTHLPPHYFYPSLPYTDVCPSFRGLRLLVPHGPSIMNLPMHACMHAQDFKVHQTLTINQFWCQPSSLNPPKPYLLSLPVIRKLSVPSFVVYTPRENSSEVPVSPINHSESGAFDCIECVAFFSLDVQSCENQSTSCLSWWIPINSGSIAIVIE